MPDFDLDAALASDDHAETGNFGLGWIGDPESIPPWGYSEGDEIEGEGSDEDIAEAARQGWGLFGDGYGNTQLQKVEGHLDGPDVFESDRFAWHFVWSNRLRDYTCAKALVVLMTTSPEEFNRVRRHFAA